MAILPRPCPWPDTHKNYLIVKLNCFPFQDSINVLRRKWHSSTDTMARAHFRSKPIVSLNKLFWISHVKISFSEGSISKFLFENSGFQIAEAFQSLLCDGRSAAVAHKRARAEQRLWYRLYFFEINRKCAMGNSVMFMLLQWYCHKGFGCSKMITFAFKMFKIFGDVYTRDGTIPLCQWCNASAQVVMSHNRNTQV